MKNKEREGVTVLTLEDVEAGVGGGRGGNGAKPHNSRNLCIRVLLYLIVLTHASVCAHTHRETQRDTHACTHARTFQTV